MLLQCNYITNIVFVFNLWRVFIRDDCSVASQHPLVLGLPPRGWLLRNIPSYWAYPHADGCFATSPRIGLTQIPLRTSASLMFLLLHSRRRFKASFSRLLKCKSPHCSCGLCDRVRIQT